MADGFFRRIFSFGTNRAETRPAADAPKTGATEPIEERAIENAEAPLPGAGSVDLHDAAPIQAAEAEAEEREAEPQPEPGAAAAEPTPVEPPPVTDPSAEPGRQGDPLPERSELAPPEAGSPDADEPAWLAAEAPEPEADFSWLDEPKDIPEPAGERPTPAAEDSVEGPPLPAPEPVRAASPAVEDPTPPSLPPPSVVARDKRDEFAWLDADAPLPPGDDEEEADFSFLDAPAPREAGPRISTGEAGWRLREAEGEPAPAGPAPPRLNWTERMRAGLARSSGQLSASITALFTKRRLDEETLQDFEDVLIQADLGVETAMRITDRLSQGRFGREVSDAEVRAVLAGEVEATLRPVALPLELDLEKKPHVMLVVGVNGTGKTTTIGKLTAKLTRAGLKVTLCAGDTFRAAAIEQLKIWGERTESPVIAKAIGADAAGLAFEAYDEAVANGSDVLIIDTAGRLQNRTELMDELAKIVRVLQKREADAPHTVLQTLDATTGQNALQQVEIFRNVAGVNGLVMTKLDGTARGGILVAIAAKYELPVYFIGVGEGIDDLEPFRARDFAEGIAGTAPAPASVA